MNKEKLEWFKKHRETMKKDDIGNAWILLEVDDYDWLLKAVEDQHRDIMRIKKAFKEKEDKKNYPKPMRLKTSDLRTGL